MSQHMPAFSVVNLSAASISGYSTYPANAILSNAFLISKITSITIPSSVISIGDGAFDSWTVLLQ